MGLIIFVIASGLTLVFGLMDVLNFGHGVFIALGAFVATSVMGHGPGRAGAARQAVAIFCAMLVAMAVAGCRGLGLRARDRAPGLRPAPEADPHHDGRHDRRRGDHQGDLGPAADRAAAAPVLRGAWLLGDVAIEKYRVLAVPSAWWCSRLLVFTLNRTKIGLLIRAGVQDREMVEALGYRIRRLFVGVFVAGSALAGLGGVLWGLYQQSVTPQIGAQVNVLIFIVIIIGGLGSARWAASSARCWSG
jgi:branched-chain amino acid transport system permease protein